LLEAIELDDALVAVSRKHLDLPPPRRATPLRRYDLGCIEREGAALAAARGLPTETGLCETSDAVLLGEVEVDVVERLPVDTLSVSDSEKRRALQ
jgi:hypothetical protein